MSSQLTRGVRAAGLLCLAIGCTAGFTAAPAAATATDTVPPSVPQNVRDVNTDRSGNAVLAWDASTDNSGQINHYWVLVDGSQRARPKATTYRIQTLVDLCRITPGAHRITVQAVDWSLNRSAPSAPIDIVVS